MKEMPNLICGKVAVGGNYNSTRDNLSFLVNMRYIAKISSYVLTLTIGKEISVPKSRYAQVKRQYMLFKGEE